MTLPAVRRTVAVLAAVALTCSAAAQDAWAETTWAYPEPGEEVRAFVAEATGGDEGRLVLGCRPPVGDASTGPLFVAFESPAFAGLVLENRRLSWLGVTARYQVEGGEPTPFTVDFWRRSEDGGALFADGTPARIPYAWIEAFGAAAETTFAFWFGREPDDQPDVRMTVPTAGAYQVATDRLDCFEGAG
jgi:hypothetical protein